jgi:hypothetical protein
MGKDPGIWPFPALEHFDLAVGVTSEVVLSSLATPNVTATHTKHPGRWRDG